MTQTPAPTRELLDSLVRLTRVIKSGRLSTGPLDTGLGRAEVGVLRWLEAHEQSRGNELACAFGLSPSVVSRQLTSLEARGLVVRRPDPHDARAGLVSLTTEGRERLDAMSTVLEDRLAGFVEGYDDRQLHDAAQLLTHLADALLAASEAATPVRPAV